MIEIRPTTFIFPSKTGGEQVLDQVVTFSAPPKQPSVAVQGSVQVAISGFEIGYTNKDRSVWRQKIRFEVIYPVPDNDVNPDPNIKKKVRVKCHYLFRDSSGNTDDPFDGRVDVLVIADVG